MITARRVLGDAGEQAVVDWLTNKGFSILARNFTTQRGEIDIIASHDDVIAFIEVKTRKKIYFPISDSVTYSKQQKIIYTAQTFVLRNKIRNKVLRFDVAVVTSQENLFDITLIENAFRAE